MRFSVLAILPFLASEALYVAARPAAGFDFGREDNRHLERGGQQNNRGGRSQPPPRNNNKGQQNLGGKKTTPPPPPPKSSSKNTGNNGKKTTPPPPPPPPSKSSNKNGAGNNNKGVTTTAAASSTSITANKGSGFAAGGSVDTTTTAAAATSTTAASSSGNNGAGEQSSLELDPSLIGPNLAENGLAGAEPGQVASLTSTNNYINFCATTGQPVTNGLQQVGGSCNPVPMGQIPAKTAMPSCKFVFPPNGATVPANQNFTVQLAVKNFNTGAFTNPDSTYYAAPQQLNGAGLITGHSHVVIEALSSLGSTTVSDPTVFAFFKGLNAAAVGGILTAVVTGGLPAGAYKVTSINTAANHQPVLCPVAQHGSTEDVSYFTVQ